MESNSGSSFEVSKSHTSHTWETSLSEAVWTRYMQIMEERLGCYYDLKYLDLKFKKSAQSNMQVIRLEMKLVGRTFCCRWAPSDLWAVGPPHPFLESPSGPATPCFDSFEGLPRCSASRSVRFRLENEAGPTPFSCRPKDSGAETRNLTMLIPMSSSDLISVVEPQAFHNFSTEQKRV